MNAKQRYFQKVYDQALLVECECGCGQQIKNKDKYGRDKKYVNGHNGRKYDDPKQYKREWRYRNRKTMYLHKLNYGRRRKGLVLELKGGECSNCSLKYDGTNASVFDLHHREPEQKEFMVNTRTLINNSWKKILVEIDKCDILCANCHRLNHNGEY